MALVTFRPVKMHTATFRVSLYALCASVFLARQICLEQIAVSPFASAALQALVPKLSTDAARLHRGQGRMRRRGLIRVGLAAQAVDVDDDSSEVSQGDESRAKVIVCQGSSCLGRCVGNFDPMDSFKELASEDDSIVLEEVVCMNMCKRGPNARLVVGGEVVTITDHMNELEERRKAFQGLSNHQRVVRVWKLLQGFLDHSLKGSLHGPPPK
eukprot:TRINITY_DN90552_c0_g1_i1.p1 TRINITY_DN90552_c0_g1~~TRINITY_DN90552_c0_g1_i1.p1  ORF type:complete len:212 (+),score=25.52 TRINITY_DN90552_c0_g1_i1:56-691(+)